MQYFIEKFERQSLEIQTGQSILVLYRIIHQNEEGMDYILTCLGPSLTSCNVQMAFGLK